MSAIVQLCNSDDLGARREAQNEAAGTLGKSSCRYEEQQYMKVVRSKSSTLAVWNSAVHGRPLPQVSKALGRA